MEHPELARRLKRQMDDIIDIAYMKRPERQRKQCKNFTLLCVDDESTRMNGVCTYLRNGSSEIKILRLKNATYRAVLLTTIHEVSHHVANTLFRAQGHNSKFYQVHLELLFATFDMGLLSKDDVINSCSTSQILNDIIIKRNMLDTYVPNPVNYKQDAVQIFVYHAEKYKEQLRARGYIWNGVDESWLIETIDSLLHEEQEYLRNLGVRPENIKVLHTAQVVARLRKTVCLYNVPAAFNEAMQALGYELKIVERSQYWQKTIESNAIASSEYDALNKIPGIHITVT